MFSEPITPENAQDHVEHLVSYMGGQLDQLATPMPEEHRDRVTAARVALAVLTQVRDAMRVRAAWLADRHQVADTIGSITGHLVKGGFGRTTGYVDGTLALRVWEWKQAQPVTLQVGVAYGTDKDEGTVQLPDSWWTMTRDEQEEWADEALQVHVTNAVDSWWTLLDANGKPSADQLDPTDPDAYEDLA